ncbi:extracellular serine/threonine protein kinase four-jointed [Danaus plexippus]|uniref:extracellular serine/threonine protein kinase four-jointed n=1 Tax=Danaus plexippus TaxID=13037 RepID=UPI002AB24C45|nr:extracellular serine/threonine protein kinase four-jointed [Danaus plexippus]
MASSTDKTNRKCEIERLPSLKDINNTEKGTDHKIGLNFNWYKMRRPHLLYNSCGYREEQFRRLKKEYGFYSYCMLSVGLSFVLGLVIGAAIVGSPATSPNFIQRKLERINSSKVRVPHERLNSLKLTGNSDEQIKKERDGDRFSAVSFVGSDDPRKYKVDVYPKGLTDDMREILKDTKASDHKHSLPEVVNGMVHVPNDNTVLYNNIYWGPAVENSMPQGYGENSAEIWEKYVDQSEVIKMEAGCGRMQNRLITFQDGIQACVRYRQNTDQIQGEIFSFYVARLLNLTNLAPSVVKVVDLKDKLWQNVANNIATAQWNTNRAVVITQYIPSLDSATIPEIFKPSTRHLNKIDIYKMSVTEKNDTKQLLIDKIRAKNIKTKIEVADDFDYVDVKVNKKTIELFVELAQWSDLIVFDYLTANLDRIVNNLFNYQWNINIMDGPAHNLARKMDSGLLLFLDNESGLLHGYRLLKKYNTYHSLMLDNLCVFRKSTVDALKVMHRLPIGKKLSEVFHQKNSAVIRDILPPLPEKNAKILHERLGKVLAQVDKCEQSFGKH